MKQKQTIEDQLFRINTILRYYALKGVCKEKCVDIKRKLLKDETTNK